MIYSIFRNNILLVNVKPNDNSELVQKKQSEDFIRLNFTLEDYIDIRIGDYISFAKTEQFYILNKKPRVVESPKNNKYECIFEGGIHHLKKTKVLLETPKANGEFYQDYKFPLTGNAETFLLFIVDNLNRNGTGYTVGTSKLTATLTVTFNNWNVFEAISELAQKLTFSWYLNGKELNFDEKGYTSVHTVQVGRLSGFIDLTRIRVQSENIETVVYGYGSTQNLPPRTAETGPTYDGDLLTENRLSFDGLDGQSKLENNTDIYGRIESVQEYDQIKPERIGTVTDVETNVRIFYDTDIDFDVNEQLLPGITPKLTFLTGTLIGITFEILFNNDTQSFTLDYYTDESGQYPNDLIKPVIGDQYVLFNIVMPTSYIVVAQEQLEIAVQAYIDKQSQNLELFEGKLDEEWVEANNVILDLGDVLRVVSVPFLIDNLYEIKELVQNIVNPNKYAIKFGDVLPKSLLSVLRQNAFDTQQQIYSIENNTYTTVQTTNQITSVTVAEQEWIELE